jgi:hypothetical protein
VRYCDSALERPRTRPSKLRPSSFGWKRRRHGSATGRLHGPRGPAKPLGCKRGAALDHRIDLCVCVPPAEDAKRATGRSLSLALKAISSRRPNRLDRANPFSRKEYYMQNVVVTKLRSDFTAAISSDQNDASFCLGRRLFGRCLSPRFLCRHGILHHSFGTHALFTVILEATHPNCIDIAS